MISNSERFETASRILNDDSQPLSVRLEQLDPLASAINRYLYVPDTGLTLPMMLGTCRAAARVTLQSTGEIDDRLRDALTALAEAPRTDDHLDQLEALHTLVNHLKELQDRTATGVQYAVITLLEIRGTTRSNTISRPNVQVRFLKRRHRDSVDEECWISSNRTRFLGGGHLVGRRRRLERMAL